MYTKIVEAKVILLPGLTYAESMRRRMNPLFVSIQVDFVNRRFQIVKVGGVSLLESPPCLALLFEEGTRTNAEASCEYKVAYPLRT